MGSKRTWIEKMPDSSLELCEKNLDLFFKTMFERQEIWYKRFILKEEFPWTNNKILRDNKFTNVYRELDRNSQWQIKNVFQKETSRKELIWKILLFRFFNQPDFFDWVGKQEKTFKGKLPSYDEYDVEEWYQLLHSYREIGGNPFTTAYLTNTAAFPGKTRIWSFGYKIIPKIHENVPKIMAILLKSKSPEEIIKFLNSLPSISNFMSHEFYQDFTYSVRYSGIQLMKWDQDDFTNVGPGAATGIRLIFPDKPMRDKSQKQHIFELRDISKDYLEKFGDFKYLDWDGEKYIVNPNGKLSAHQIEMWLCEFQKYWKMKIGEGKQRSKFKPRTKEIFISKN